MPLFTRILCAGIGAALILVGYLLWFHQRITLIHSYHYTFVREEDKPAYTALMGQACIVMGAGILLCGFINYLTNTAWGWLAFTAGFLAGIIMITKAQKTYNKRNR